MEKWKENDIYLMQHLIPEDATLKNALETSRAANLPEHETSPTQGKFLYLLAQIKGAKRILELGTLGGYSTIWLAKDLPNDGIIISIEYCKIHADIAQKNIEFAGLSHKVEIILGDAVDVMEMLISKNCQPFDMIFVDADKPSYPRYLELALRLSKPGTIIYADNIVRNGELCNPSNPDEKVKGVRQYVENLGKLTHVESTALQTVGIKGYDGFTISVVN